MASSLALKRLVSSNLLPKSFLSPIRPVASFRSDASRYFNTNAARDYGDEDSDGERGADVDRRSGRFKVESFSEDNNPFFITPSLRRQFQNRMAKFNHKPFSSASSGIETDIKAAFRDIEAAFSGFEAAFSGFRAASRGIEAEVGRGWDSRETDDALKLRFDMPGFGKEDVKVSVEQNTLIIKGEVGGDGGDKRNSQTYTSSIDLPEELYKIDQAKAEMKNGVLKVLVPKVKDDEDKGSGVFHVKVE